MVRPQQGDIYWVKFGRTGDSGPSGKRPAIVIQNDLLNISNIQTTVVSLITSNKKLGEIPGNATPNISSPCDYAVRGYADNVPSEHMLGELLMKMPIKRALVFHKNKLYLLICSLKKRKSQK